MAKNTFNPVNLGISVGSTVAIGMVFAGILGSLGYGKEVIDLISTWYVGYGTNPVGILLGAFWGFIDGFIGGFLIGYIYNKLENKK